MKDARMKVLRFDESDVIATSVECTNYLEHLFVTSVYEDCDEWYANGTKYSYKNGGWKSGENVTDISFGYFDGSTAEQNAWYYSYVDFDEGIGMWGKCENNHTISN